MCSPLTPNMCSSFPTRAALFSNSIGAYAMCCAGLVNLVAKELGHQALDVLQSREWFSEDPKIEIRL